MSKSEIITTSIKPNTIKMMSASTRCKALPTKCTSLSPKSTHKQLAQQLNLNKAVIVASDYQTKYLPSYFFVYIQEMMDGVFLHCVEPYIYWWIANCIE